MRFFALLAGRVMAAGRARFWYVRPAGSFPPVLQGGQQALRLLWGAGRPWAGTVAGAGPPRRCGDRFAWRTRRGRPRCVQAVTAAGGDAVAGGRVPAGGDAVAGGEVPAGRRPQWPVLRQWPVVR